MAVDANKSSVTIALLWHTFGHGNLGVDALARANASLVRQAAAAQNLSVRFVSLGTGQNYDAEDLPPDVTIGPRPRIKPLLYGKSDFLKAVRRSDLVLDIGEGDSFTDIYGLRRYGFLLGTKIAVVLAGRPLVIAPQTIGPFDNPVRRWLAVAALRRARAVYARDGLSMQFLKDNGVDGETDEFIDVAFALPFSPTPKTTDRVRVGINVSGLLYNGGYSGRNEFGLQLDYRKLTHDLIENLMSRDGVEVHLVAHVSGSGGQDDDYPVLLSLKQRYPAIVAAPIFATSVWAKSYLAGLDYVVAGRMHACIGAFSAGVPVMPIAYSRKFNGLFATLGYPHLVDAKTTGNDEALARILDGFARRQDLAVDVAHGCEEATRRLSQYRETLARLLAEVNHG